MIEEYESIVNARDLLPQSELMVAAAEKSAKLAQELLQFRRVIDDTNPTRKPYSVQVVKVNRAWAELKLCMTQLSSIIDEVKVLNIMHVENAVWTGRLIRKRKELDELAESKVAYDKRAGKGGAE